jgi:K+-sensing histidine kinase KdpD
MLNELDAFVAKAVSFFRLYALGYMDRRNRKGRYAFADDGRGHKVRIHIDDSLSYRESVNTILDPLPGVPAQQMDVLFSMYHLDRREAHAEKEDSLNEAFHYFRYGCKWFSLENSSMHDARTKLMMVKIRDTPEQLLVSICRSALVIGMSATADSPSATEIFIEIRKDARRIWLTVADNGDGIPPQLLGVLFDGYLPLGAVEASDRSCHMGIGLSVCRAIVRAHGGEIYARNKIDGGAEFRFWLPAEEESNT